MTITVKGTLCDVYHELPSAHCFHWDPICVFAGSWNRWKRFDWDPVHKNQCRNHRNQTVLPKAWVEIFFPFFSVALFYCLESNRTNTRGQRATSCNLTRGQPIINKWNSLGVHSVKHLLLISSYGCLDELEYSKTLADSEIPVVERNFKLVTDLCFIICQRLQEWFFCCEKGVQLIDS